MKDYLILFIHYSKTKYATNNFLVSPSKNYDIHNFKISSPLNVKSLKGKQYLIIPFTFNTKAAVEYLFYINFKEQNKFDAEEIYINEYNLELPILKIFSQANFEFKLKICQNIVSISSEYKVPMIFDRYHSGKTTLYSGINETLSSPLVITEMTKTSFGSGTKQLGQNK